MNFSELTSSIPFFGPMHTLINLGQTSEQPTLVTRREEKKEPRKETEQKTKNVVCDRLTNCYVSIPEGEKEIYTVEPVKIPFNQRREKEKSKEEIEKFNKKGLPSQQGANNYQKLIQDFLNKDPQQIQKISKSDLNDSQQILNKLQPGNHFISKQELNQYLEKQNKFSLVSELNEEDILEALRNALKQGIIQKTDIIQAARGLGMMDTAIYKLDFKFDQISQNK